MCCLGGKKKEVSFLFISFVLQFYRAPSDFHLMKKCRIIIPYSSPCHSQLINLNHTSTKLFSQLKGPTALVEFASLPSLDINAIYLFNFNFVYFLKNEVTRTAGSFQDSGSWIFVVAFFFIPFLRILCTVLAVLYLSPSS